MENLFVRCTDSELVVEGLRSYRRATESAEGWSCEPKYPTTFKVSPLRTSLEAGPDFPRHWCSPTSGEDDSSPWDSIQVISREDVVDLGLARWLSKRLDTRVIAVFSHEGLDMCGSRTYRSGELRDDTLHEREARPDYRTDCDLATRGIPYSICLYDACQGPGWITVDVAG